jgi:hypothetical protein
VCIKHEHIEHKIVTWREEIGCKDKETTKSKAVRLEEKPNAIDQSKSKEMKQFKS